MGLFGAQEPAGRGEEAHLGTIVGAMMVEATLGTCAVSDQRPLGTVCCLNEGSDALRILGAMAQEYRP